MIITSTFMAIALVGTPAPTAAVNDAAATTTTATTVATAPAAPRAAEKRYCIVETPTGSRMQRKTCKTRADWASTGVTIDR